MKWYILICLFVGAYCEKGPEAEIKHGKLEGKYMKTATGRIIHGFLGIPYAKPPINELRFKDTILNEPWDGVYKADKDKSNCTQRDFFTGGTEVHGDEDCLYLNVYTPKIPANTNETYPVMVFIHGGAYMLGSGHSSMYGPDYILDKDIVLVVINYRLGPLGFLSTEDDVVPGNMGLKDQVMALKWVQENIASFRGDKNRVTLFGQSAGGASVNFHMFSPLSNGLFHRAIVQSGVSFSRWALAPEGEAKNHAQKLAEIYNCPSNSSEQIVECLRTINAKKLTGNMEQFFVFDIEPIVPFKPVIEHKHPNAFLTEHPLQTQEKGKVNIAELIIGMNSEEGCLRATRIFPNSKKLKEFIKDFNKLAPVILFYGQIYTDVENVTQQIKKFYFNDFKEKNRKKLLHGIMNLYSDAWISMPIREEILLHLNNTNTPIYLYYFQYRGTYSNSVLYDSKSNYDYGVCHGDELLYILSVIHNKTESESDNNVTNVMTDLWTSFAKNGKPTLNNEDIWNPASLSDEKYLYIKNSKDITMSKNPINERIQFWRNLPSRRDYIYY